VYVGVDVGVVAVDVVDRFISNYVRVLSQLPPFFGT
jgi:hypothetical protein